MFSSRRFIVSGLRFRSLIHFEFIFTYGVKKCSNFFLLHYFIYCFPFIFFSWRLITLQHCSGFKIRIVTPFTCGFPCC